MPREADPEKGITFQRTPEEQAEWNRRFLDLMDQSNRLQRAIRIKSKLEEQFGSVADSPPNDVLRKPLSTPQRLHTFVWGGGNDGLFQMEWDYFIHWPEGGEPEIKIGAYRCFQRCETDQKFKLMEYTVSDIPMTQEVLGGIANQAAQILHATATVKGGLQLLDEYFLRGAADAARKGYDLRLYREMLQRSVSGHPTKSPDGVPAGPKS